MIKVWSTFSADDKRHCIAETIMGGKSSYTELITCLEMARDVRALHKRTPPRDFLLLRSQWNRSVTFGVARWFLEHDVDRIG
jgi:hypothetical protein